MATVLSQLARVLPEPDLSISKVLEGFVFGLKRYFCPCHYDLDILAEAAFDQT